LAAFGGSFASRLARSGQDTNQEEKKEGEEKT
jgi:hypothetical protein